MKQPRPVQLPLSLLDQVPRIPRATARSVPPAGFGASVASAGIGNVACREGVSRGTALRWLKRTGPTVLRPVEPAKAAGPRPCPDGFDAAYIEHGYDECEVIFRASPATVKRWLEERGKKRLRKARAAFVKARRVERKAAAAPKPKPVKVKRGRAIDPELARLAAEHLRGRPHQLRVMRMTDDSAEWYVDGRGRLCAADMLAIAKAKGFVVPANLSGKRPKA